MIRRSRAIRSLVIAALATIGAAAMAERPAVALEPTVETFTLENGLRVFIRPIQGATGAFAQLLYTIGEQDDPPGQSGLAHLVAQVHASARAGDVLPALVHAVGPDRDGRHDVIVHDDYTAFCEAGPADSFRAVLQELALRMGNLRVDAADLARSKQRLPSTLVDTSGGLGGVRRMRSDALRAARAAARDRLLPLPGGGSRGGEYEEASTISLDVVRERWRRFYKPANAILSIAGDVDPVLVRKGVRRQFAGIPAGERLAPAHPVRATTSAHTVVVDSESGGLPDSSPRSPADVTEPLAACVSIVAPPASDSRRLAAALVLAARFARPEAAPDDDAMSRFGELPPRADFRPLLDARTIDLVWSEPDMPAAEASIASLRAWLSAAAEQPVTDADARRLREDPRLGPRLVSDEPDEQYPCQLALGIARRAQLGIDGQRLLDEVPKVTVDDLRAVAGAASASAVAWSMLSDFVSRQRRALRLLRAPAGEGVASPQPGEVHAVGTAEGAVVREEPKPLGRRVARAPSESRVRVLEVRGTWVRVESVAEPRFAGWMRVSDLR